MKQKPHHLGMNVPQEKVSICPYFLKVWPVFLSVPIWHHCFEDCNLELTLYIVFTEPVDYSLYFYTITVLVISVQGLSESLIL